ncbi:hypothetical protein GCM10027519_44300 [Kineococcus endophyticus]
MELEPVRRVDEGVEATGPVRATAGPLLQEDRPEPADPQVDVWIGLRRRQSREPRQLVGVRPGGDDSLGWDGVLADEDDRAGGAEVRGLVGGGVGHGGVSFGWSVEWSARCSASRSNRSAKNRR